MSGEKSFAHLHTHTEYSMLDGAAFGRSLMEQILRLIGVVSIVLGLPWLLDMLWPLWDARNQTLHDKVAKTVVIRARATG